MERRLTSAPRDRLRLLEAGDGSADRRGVRPSFLSCSPDGDFGTVHTGTPSKTKRKICPGLGPDSIIFCLQLRGQIWTENLQLFISASTKNKKHFVQLFLTEAA